MTKSRLFCGLILCFGAGINCNAGTLERAHTDGRATLSATPVATTTTAQPATPATPGTIATGAPGQVAGAGPQNTNLPLPAQPAAGQRALRTTNLCKQTVWMASLPNAKIASLSPGGYALLPGTTRDIILPAGWAGRLWGRTGCVFDAAGNGSCESGDCGPRLECVPGVGGQPSSLAEIFVGSGTVNDTYDVSLVDAFNLPLAFGPLGVPADTSDMYHCGRPSCTHDLLASCPNDLIQRNKAGAIVSCFSACSQFNTDAYCCRGPNNLPSTCPPSTYSQFFKSACPLAYSYAYDDHTSTYTCVEAYAYEMVFCPPA